MSDDIVTRLRQIPTVFPLVREAADEIERLRAQLEMWQDGNIMAESHRDEIAKLERTAEVTYENHRRIVAELTAERDEARREVCQKHDHGYFMDEDYAEIRGWDCFKEAGK